ncbi:MAG: HEAT repeat domain-containing protein [Planctomycetes bacterium]|nr:HEAT repeat domain-containing protein [Planctomycetota bacterium]
MNGLLKLLRILIPEKVRTRKLAAMVYGLVVGVTFILAFLTLHLFGPRLETESGELEEIHLLSEQIEKREIVMPLARHLNSKYESCRYQAAFHLATLERVAMPAVSKVTETFETDESLRVRLEAARALLFIRPENRQPLVEIVKMLDNPNIEPSSVAYVLWRVAKKGEMPGEKIIAMTRHPWDDSSRVFAIQALSIEADDPEPAVKRLVELVEDPLETYNMKLQAIQSLGQLGPVAKSAVPTLVEALNSEFQELKTRVLQSLGQIHSNEEVAIPALIEMLNAEETPYEIQRWVIQALWNFEKDQLKRAIPDFMALLRSGRSPDLRRSCCEFLGMVAAREAVDDLVLTARSRDEFVSESALAALGKIAVVDKLAQSRLLAIANDADPTIRACAQPEAEKLKQTLKAAKGMKALP